MLDMLTNFFVIKGHTELSVFWTSPIGAIICVILFITSLINIFRRDYDMITDIYNWVIAITAAVSLLHVYEDSMPKHQMMVIVSAITLKRVWEQFLYMKNGRTWELK